jgi:hypothetical protein
MNVYDLFDEGLAVLDDEDAFGSVAVLDDEDAFGYKLYTF